jgi:hypothetical protein
VVPGGQLTFNMLYSYKDMLGDKDMLGAFEEETKSRCMLR